MNNLDTIYDQALKMLEKGRSKEEVLLKFAKEKAELSPLLDLSLSLLSMPKNIVPTPLMQRKYSAVPVKHLWLSWFHVSKLAGVSMSVMLLISAISVTGYEAAKSAPGQTLFAVKKSAEKFQLILASSQDAKANLQIQITQARLGEAQAIFNDPSSNTDQKNAALNELTEQTNSAVAQVNSATQSDPNPDKSHPLLSVLDTITQKQKNLFAKIKPDTQIQNATDNAINALNANTAKLSQIKESVVAATNSQVLTSLTDQPNSVVVYGQITQISKDQITIEKVPFLFGGQTVIKDADGNTISVEALTTGTKANVVGLKNQNTLVAQQILIAPVTDNATTTPISTDKKPATPIKEEGQTSTPTSIKKIDSIPETATNSNTGTASASFIYESPAPQYVK